MYNSIIQVHDMKYYYWIQCSDGSIGEMYCQYYLSMIISYRNNMK